MAWAPDYCTAQELTDFVRIGDTDDAVQVGLAIAAASRAIDRATRRQFGQVAAVQARYYTAHQRADDLWVVPIDDLMTDTGLLVAFDTDGDETYADDLTAVSLRERNAAAEGRPWTELVVLAGSDVQPTTALDAVKVTAQWGWTDIPDAIKQACLLQASRVLSRRDSPFGVTGSPESGGGELRLLARVDPDVEVALAPYRRKRPRAVFA